MRGVYTAQAAHSSLAAAKNVLILTAPSNAVLEILSASVTNRTQETNEQLEIGLYRGDNYTDADIGTATALTEVPTEDGDQAASAAATHTWTDDPDTGSPIDVKGVASLSGYYYDPTPEERCYVQPGKSVLLRVNTATFTAFDVVATICWREIG